MQENELGQATLCRRKENRRFVNVRTVGTASQMIQNGNASCTSKLDLVVALFQRQWVPGQPGVAFTNAGERLFVCSHIRPTSYFACLIRCAELFEKGIVEIPHRAQDLAYQAMVRLSGEALAKFLRRLALGDFEEVWLKAHFKKTWWCNY